MPPEDEFFQRHFARMDADLAASFTPEQRRAIWVMFGAQPTAAHSVDVRRSVRVFGKQFYFVFFAGPEKRSRERLEREGAVSRGVNAAATALGTVVLAAPAAAFVYVLAGAFAGASSFGGRDTGTLTALWEQFAFLLSGG